MRLKILVPTGAFALLLLPTDLPRSMQASASLFVAPAPGRLLTGTIGRNQTLARLLQGSLTPAAVHELVETARPAYDLARLSVGHPFGLALTPDGLVRAFTYGIDELRTLRVRRGRSGLEAEVLTRTYETRSETAAGAITSSLFEAIEEAGEDDQLALDLADIFAWDVDFNTEIQRGDSFRVAVEKLYLDGRFARYGRILAAEFVRGERVLRAVRFDAARGPGYYAPDGTPLRKAFLRSPLRFTRISSRFSAARLHPILNVVRPHFGVDYAAPAGTPVGASADGVVREAGFSGGFGKLVRLRHANGFETLYGHLSRIDVRVGQRVVQGQRIGSVGATGLATAPHLDYRMLRDGRYVNPLRIQTPPAEPLSAEESPAFAEARTRALALLATVPEPPSARLAAAAPRATEAPSRN
ncbi:MAG TPA: peptidoglycan DD-metalloendopeptidase family protein [Vicinamibacteria bacterium]|nr:peptidoglycan DD-metalloendopeptidase family protein [Vicinamibacteria bacterium]